MFEKNKRKRLDKRERLDSKIAEINTLLGDATALTNTILNA